MSIPNNNYPKDAIKVRFKPLDGRRHLYFIWSRDSRWFWFTLGQSGVEDTQEQAMAMARDYIRGIVH